MRPSLIAQNSSAVHRAIDRPFRRMQFESRLKYGVSKKQFCSTAAKGSVAELRGMEEEAVPGGGGPRLLGKGRRTYARRRTALVGTQFVNEDTRFCSTNRIPFRCTRDGAKHGQPGTRLGTLARLSSSSQQPLFPCLFSSLPSALFLLRRWVPPPPFAVIHGTLPN